MATEIKIEPEALPGALLGEAERARQAQQDACFAAALHLVAHLKQLSDELGITYSGVWKNSNKAMRTEDGAVTYNDAPHAGIVEEGCRPHWMPAEAIDGQLTDWVRRKLEISDEAEARGVAWAIANKIAAEGMKGRFPYRDSLELAKEFYAEEFERLMRQ